MVAPTIGRKVWYFEAPGRPEQDATIVDVTDPKHISVVINHRDCTQSSRSGLTLVQPGEPLPEGEHATWMPYQIATNAPAAPAA